MSSAAAFQTGVRGTTPYYVVELLSGTHTRCLWLFWAACFGFFIYLLASSDNTQFECFSFCDTTMPRSCSMLRTDNGSDVSWVDAASSCFNPTESSNWSSAGAFSLNTTNAIGQDVIPDMGSSGHRYSRFILRFSLSDYAYTPGAAFTNASLAPRVHGVQLVGGAGDVLAAPVVLGTVSFRSIQTTDGDASVIFELPTGYRFPTGTQQFVLEFPAGPPLKAVNATTAPGTSGPLQLTFATSSPTYLMYEMFARYVLLVVTCAVVVLVMCLHALSDTATYDVFHPSVPSFDGWFACFSTVLFVMERESLVRDVWPRLPLIVKASVVGLCIMAFLCDPLVGAFYALPDNVGLEVWSVNVMPWLRFSWMVLTSAWLLACMMTCGDQGKMYTTARRRHEGAVKDVTTRLGGVESEVDLAQRPEAAGVAPQTEPSTAAVANLPPCLLDPHALPDTSIVSSSFKAKLLLLLFSMLPPALYFGSVVAAGRGGDSSQPSAVGHGRGKNMIASIVAMEIYPPMLLALVYYYAQRSLYARFPNGVADVLPSNQSTPFGVPSAENNGRAFVVATRFLLPFCVWASMFMSWTYFGTLAGLSKLLPSYDNGHLVEVLINVLIGWTVTWVLVPVRKSLTTFPPRPSLYPPPPPQSQGGGALATSSAVVVLEEGVSPTTTTFSTASCDPHFPLWCQVPWPSSYFKAIKTGAVPNCGYAFHTEAHEMAFFEVQRLHVVDPPPPKPTLRRTFVFGQRRLAITTVTTAPAVRRSFFCWETGVRCLNMSNEAYLDVAGDVDLSYYAAAEPYEHSCIETCIESRCCCFWPALVGGGCAPRDRRDDHDYLPGNIGVSVEGGGGVDQDGDEGHLAMSHSSRRFAEAGAAAVDVSRLSFTNREMRPEAGDPLTAEGTAVDVEMDAVHHHHHHHQPSSSVTQAHDTTSIVACRGVGDEPLRETLPVVLSAAPQHADDAMNSLNVVVTSQSCTSLTSDTPILALGNSRGATPAPTVQPKRLVPASRSATPALTPRSIVANDPATMKRQINVARYGYELIKVLDVFGVRILLAATPRGTTGRLPHLCIAFRGTVNLRNALTNINASMSPLAEMNDKDAEVHSGFLLAFQELLPTLTLALRSFLFKADYASTATDSVPTPTQWAKELTHVMCTGHSLGGALAMLCAHSIVRGALCRDVFSKLSASPAAPTPTPTAKKSATRTSHPLIPMQLRCYTYGAPSFGNSRFAELYNDAVPESYRVVNENDIIPHLGFCWHAHAGREVRINRDGDAVVEGTFLERHYASLLQGVGSRFKNHLLVRYGNSLDNCLCARNLAMLSPDCCSCVMVHVD